MSEEIDQNQEINTGLVVIKPKNNSLSDWANKFIDLMSKEKETSISKVAPCKNEVYYNQNGLVPAKIVLTGGVEKDGVIDYTQEIRTYTQPTSADYKMAEFMSSGFGMTLNTNPFRKALELQKALKYSDDLEAKEQADMLVELERASIQEKVLNKHASIQNQTGIDSIRAIGYEINYQAGKELNILEAGSNRHSFKEDSLSSRRDSYMIEPPTFLPKRLGGGSANRSGSNFPS